MSLINFFTLTVVLHLIPQNYNPCLLSFFEFFVESYFDFTTFASSINAAFEINVNGLTCMINNTSSGDYTALLWNFGDGKSDSTTLFPTHNYDSAGIYHVCFLIEDPLTGQSDMYCKDVKVGNEAIESITNHDFTVEIFPNPASQVFTIKINLPKSSTVKTSIFNLLGDKVLELENETLQKGSNNIDCEPGGLPKGIYLVKVFYKDRYLVKKLVIR